MSWAARLLHTPDSQELPGAETPGNPAIIGVEALFSPRRQNTFSNSVWASFARGCLKKIPPPGQFFFPLAATLFEDHINSA